jgi:hypothetical protein
MKEPDKNLEPQPGDSFAEMMQGAFFTMLLFLCAEFFIRLIAYAVAVQDFCNR